MTDQSKVNRVAPAPSVNIPVERIGPPRGSSRRFDFEHMQAVLPALLDSLADAVVVVDAARRVVAANRRYMEAFGHRGLDMVGMLCDDCLSCPETSEPMPARCPSCEAMDRAEPRRVLRTLPGPDGLPRRWEATFSPVIGPDGDVSHVVEVWRDISERARLEGQLAHSERLAALGTLAAGVAHEINNPLAALLAGIEGLQRRIGRGALDLDECREVLETLEEETRRVRETTDKLMLLAQPYAQKPTWVDLNRAIQDTLSLLSFESRKRKVTVETVLDPELPEMWARESGIRSVCMNLMMNAVQAMKDRGGSLRVTTRRQGDRVVFEVADTGPGIAPAILDRIWDPFFTTKPMGQGTGLGLSVTQRVVERHGGEIRVESEPEAGARFVVTLPISGPGGDGV